MNKCSVDMLLHMRYKGTVVIFLLKSITVCPWGAIESCKNITPRRTNLLEKMFWPEHTTD